MVYLPGGAEAHQDFQDRRAVEFTGSSGAFMGLAARGAALLLVTFGFYRFWLATDIRKMLWRDTRLAGEPFEYTGTGKELFIGFLMALAILAPIYIVINILGLAAEKLAVFASVFSGLFFIVFAQFALYRARRYRLSRTIWRGVRLWADGSGWAYAFRWLGWGLLSVLTLGVAYPWMRTSLERYKLNHTLYGKARAQFVGDAKGFWRFYWKFWGAGLFLFGLMAATSVYAALAYGVTATPAQRQTLGAILGVFLSIAILAFPFVAPFYKAAEWRWWANGASLGGARLSSNLRGGALLVLYVEWVLSIIGVILAIGAVIGIIAASANLSSNSFMKGGGSALMYVGLAVLYIAILLGLGVLNRYFFTFSMWRVLVSALTVHGVDKLAAVAADGGAANAVGEGLADSLDIGAM